MEFLRNWDANYTIGALTEVLLFALLLAVTILVTVYGIDSRRKR